MGSAPWHFNHPWVETPSPRMLLARFPDAPSVPQVEAFCEAFEGFLRESDEHFGWVSDLSQLRTAGAVQRKVFVDANRRAASRLNRRVVALAVYAPSPFQRGLVTFFSWFIPTEFPFKVFGDLEDARAWVQGHLRTNT